MKLPATNSSTDATNGSATRTSDVVVVGAGMGGLAAAVALGAAGRSVTVLEALHDVGGKVGTATHDGVTFDTGPSVLTLPHVLDEVLARVGHSVATHAPLVRPRPAFRYHFGSGRSLDVFVDVDETLASVRDSLGPRAADELASFLRYARGIWDASKDHFVFARAPTVPSLVRLALSRPRDLLRVDALSNMASAIARRISSTELRQLLLRYATYNGSNPFSAPATLHCIAHVELTLGAFGVRGGMRQVARALRDAALSRDVAVVTDAPVAALERVPGNGPARWLVRTASDAYGCAHVVVNADVAHLRDTLLPTIDRTLPRKTPASMSGATAVLRARRRPARVAHEVLFPDDEAAYAREFTDIFDARRAPLQPTLYLCAQEKAHDAAGWSDDEPVFCMVNAPPIAGGDEDTSAHALQVGLGRARARGLIDDGDRVVWQRTALDLARTFPGSGGALYGAASNARTSAFRRPPNAVRGCPGVFLASGSAHPGGGVPLCLQSGLLAADAVLASSR